jgi:hypothetical protein
MYISASIVHCFSVKKQPRLNTVQSTIPIKFSNKNIGFYLFISEIMEDFDIKCVASNPWQVQSINDFSFYCCPECVYRSRGDTDFEAHAVLTHPQAKLLFKNVSSSEPEESVNNFHVKIEDYSDVAVKIEYDIDQPMEDAFDPSNEVDEPLEEKTVKKPISSEPDILKSINCTQCNLSFKHQRNLESHIEVKHSVKEKASYPCQYCNKVFDWQYKLNRHAERTHNHPKPRMQCPKCPRMYSRSGLKTHLNSAHVDKTAKMFKCLECDFSSHAEKYVKSHRKTCHNKQQFQHHCPDCDLRFEFPTRLKNHICTKVKTKLNADGLETGCFKCHICTIEFLTSRTLTMHYRKFHKTIPPGAENLQQFLCEICSQVFFRSEALQGHIKRVHWSECKEIPPTKYNCPECDNEFTAIQYLNQHYTHVHGGSLVSVEGRENLFCDQCPKTFFCKTSLSIHQKAKHQSANTQSVTKKFNQRRKCPHCDTTFARLINLKEHVLSKHLKNTPFKCEQCERSYGTNYSLKLHIRTMHERRDCEICGKGICNDLVMKRHKASVHGIVPPGVHQCEHCPLFFNKEDAKIKHCAKHHTDKI